MYREDKHLAQLKGKFISISLINSKSLSCKPLDKLMMLISMMLIDQWLALHRWGLWLMMKLVGVIHRTSNSSKSSFLDVVSQAAGVPPLRAGLNPRGHFSDHMLTYITGSHGLTHQWKDQFMHPCKIEFWAKVLHYSRIFAFVSPELATSVLKYNPMITNVTSDSGINTVLEHCSWRMCVTPTRDFLPKNWFCKN